jgi:non-specific protein-tyrosine kinase
VQRLLCASSGPDEGKSTAVANLAVVFAQAGSKVVVVDADLRRPSQHVLFNLRNGSGLSSLFLGRPGSAQPMRDRPAEPARDQPAGATGESPPAAAPGQPGEWLDLPLQPTAVPNLWLLASGPPPPNPPDLLGSARMDEILDRLTAKADVVLIDSPPVVAFADAAILSAKVDGVLLVVRAGTVKRGLLRKAKAQLEAVQAPVLGAVVLNAPFDAAAFATYYPSSDGEGV